MSTDRSNVEIRRLAPTDLDAVLGVAELLAEAPHWPRERYAEAVHADAPVPRVALVARDTRSREVVGFTIASVVVPEAELETIAVAPTRQREGIGSCLLDALVRELEAAGIQQLHLEVRSSNLSAVQFYESKNFKKSGVRVHYYIDPEEDAVLMSLLIDEP